MVTATQTPERFFANGERHHVHRSYIWLTPVTVTFAIFVAVVSGFLKNLIGLERFLREQGSASGFVIIMVILALVVIYAITVGVCSLKYRNLYFEFGDSEFSVYSGIITKRHVHVPYTRVQSVNHSASILQRIVGICSVTIDTAGGATNKAVRIPYVQLVTAEHIRNDLFARKMMVPEGQAGTSAANPRSNLEAIPSLNVVDRSAGAVGAWRGAFGGEAVESEKISYELGLTNKELALTVISHSSAIAIAIVLAAVSAAGSIGAVLATDDLVMLIISSLGAIFVLLSALLGWFMGIISLVFSFGGFRARRRGSRIEVERGLLQRQFNGIDIDRVQSVVIRQSFIRRCMGYCELSLGRVDTAADHSSEKKGNKLDRNGLIVHPFVKLDRLDEVLAGLLPEFSDMPMENDMTKLPPIARGRAIRRRALLFNKMLWITLLAIVFQLAFLYTAGGIVDPSGTLGSMSHLINAYLPLLYLICVLVTVAYIASAKLWYKGSGFAISKKYAVLFNDGLHTDRTIIPRRKVQFGYTKTNPFQRHARTATIFASTAAGISPTITRLIDVDEDDAARWLEWLE